MPVAEREATRPAEAPRGRDIMPLDVIAPLFSQLLDQLS